MKDHVLRHGVSRELTTLPCVAIPVEDRRHNGYLLRLATHESLHMRERDHRHAFMQHWRRGNVSSKLALLRAPRPLQDQ